MKKLPDHAECVTSPKNVVQSAGRLQSVVSGRTDDAVLAISCSCNLKSSGLDTGQTRDKDKREKRFASRKVNCVGSCFSSSALNCRELQGW